MRKLIVLTICVMALIASISFILYFALEPSPPKIPVFPYIMENEIESTSSDENPWWPDGWSANFYHGLMGPLYVTSWYQVSLEDLGWIIEVDNFDAFQTSENVINANTLLVVIKDEWATLVATFGWYVPETGGQGESVIIVAQGSTKGLAYLLSEFSDIVPEAF